MHRRPGRAGLITLVTIAGLPPLSPDRALAQQPQNPSPMVERTRAHRRLAEARPAGRREALEPGTLFLPERLVARPGKTKTVPLAVVFHGGAWLPEVAGHQAPSPARRRPPTGWSASSACGDTPSPGGARWGPCC